MYKLIDMTLTVTKQISLSVESFRTNTFIGSRYVYTLSISSTSIRFRTFVNIETIAIGHEGAES